MRRKLYIYWTHMKFEGQNIFNPNMNYMFIGLTDKQI